MKRHTLALVLTALSALAAPQAIRPGEVWPDDRGRHIQAHGGGIIKLGDTYYWFGEDRGEGLDPAKRYVACYSSNDLAHWTFRNQVLQLGDPENLGPRRVVERPKVFYNARTKKYVMYLHIDDGAYKLARVGVAVSDTVDGDYQYLRSFRPLGQESRDIGQFIDDDGTAYLIFEDRPAKGFHIARLSDDYMTVEKEMALIMAPLEGGAVVHYKGLYYAVGSALTGWAPNPNKYATAPSLEGPWSDFKDIAPPETNTYGSQSTMLLKVVGSTGTTVVFMGDIWKPKTQWDSRYLWMPVEVGDGKLWLPPPGEWTLDVQTGEAVITGGSAHGTVERIKVRGKSLEGNLEGDSADRDVSVHLPPSYKTEPTRRYPVLYMLHGFTDSDEGWMGFKKHWINLPAVIDKALGSGASREMIVVMPNAFTKAQGSMYSASVTTGNWEEYVTKELVAYIDSHYRTLAQPASRGLAGHSMGGYGTLRLAMKHPEAFSSIYALSPCCLAPGNLQARPGSARAEAIRGFDDLAQADFGTKAMIASAAAWSPNPAKPPLFLDLPWQNGELQPAVLAKWQANAPLAMVDQYIDNLKTLKAIAFDAGNKDIGIAETIKVLDRILNDYRLPHTFEIYEGNHIDHISDRIETKVLPFFSSKLVF